MWLVIIWFYNLESIYILWLLHLKIVFYELSNKLSNELSNELSYELSNLV